ncbi:hypothetical protein [Oribacterium sinus]
MALEKNAQKTGYRVEGNREETRTWENTEESCFVVFLLVQSIRKSVSWIKFKKINETTGERKNGSGNG